jgi:hypothetical protein
VVVRSLRRDVSMMLSCLVPERGLRGQRSVFGSLGADRGEDRKGLVRAGEGLAKDMMARMLVVLVDAPCVEGLKVLLSFDPLA